VIVLDSGVLIAAADADDRHHLSCAALFDLVDEQFVVPAGVVVEVCWMLGRHVSAAAEATFLQSIAAGELAVEALTDDDYARTAELVTAYSDLSLDAVDAMVVAVAERLGVRTIATAGTLPSCAPGTFGTSIWFRT